MKASLVAKTSWLPGSVNQSVPDALMPGEGLVAYNYLHPKKPELGAQAASLPVAEMD